MGGKLGGKVAIVTGGGSGFGLGIAEKFAEEGAKVLITDINPGNGPKLAESNSSIKFLKADVSSRADWEEALETALKEFGRLDIVVNNAGILIVKVALSLSGLTSAVDDRVYGRRVRKTFPSQCERTISEYSSHHSALRKTRWGSLCQHFQQR